MLLVQSEKCLVKVTGGLGNQLFKLANGLRVSEYFGSKLILETSFYDLVAKNKDYATARAYEINYFPKVSQIPTQGAKNLFLERVVSKFWRECPSQLHRPLGFLTEEDEIAGFKHVRRVEGSFEDIKYFPPLEILHEFLRFPESMSPWLKEQIAEVESTQPLSLHVRLTDFLKTPDLYNVMSSDYYIESIRRFRNLFGNQPIWLFSDDPDAAKHFLGKKIQVDRVLGPEEHVSSAEVMNLLSRSAGICAANSTFSWWAAFLGTMNKSTKFVSIPRNFNTLSSDDPGRKLLLPGWEII
jgi:hypothetical protein